MEIFNFERIDNIGFGNLRLIQKPEDFCYGIDAVILADFAAKGGGRNKVNYYKENDSIIDLGTGTGIIPTILSHKTKCAKLVGVELQEDSFNRASRNIKLNGLEDRLHIVNGDVSDINLIERVKKLSNLQTFSAITSNPPYMKSDCAITNRETAKHIARHETTGTLEDFIKCASKLLKDKGDLYMVHRPSRLADICCISRRYNLEPKYMRFVSANKDSIPNILLVHCTKNGGNELKLLPPLYVYNEKSQYTEEIQKIYERL